MDTKFIEGALPDGYRCDFDGYLFNDPQNLKIQSLTGWQTFHALRSEKKTSRARIHFHVNDSEATSPLKNPFGSMEFSETLELRELFEFMKWVEDRLRQKGVKRIQIKSYPALYNSRCSSILNTFFLNLGYSISTAELSSCIVVTPSTLFQVMSSWEKRKVGQIRKTALRFNSIPVGKVKDVFEFISSCREERRQKLSLTYAQMKTVCDNFPDKFCLFGVYDNQALAAASISIMVNKTILYNFYSAHSKQYDALSPVVRLMEGIYEHCQTEKVRIIDLGTSALNGRPNFGLLDFKLNLGAVPTEKFTFEKTLT